MTHLTTFRGPAAMAMVTAALVLACSPASTPLDGSSTASAPATAAPTTTATGTAPAGGSVVGTWRSPSCGERTYARELALAGDGTFQAADLVSPCPPDVACVWSGIVNRKGTYAVTGANIVLTVSGDQGSQARQLPSSLGVDPGTGAPFETGSDGKTCLYARTAKP